MGIYKYLAYSLNKEKLAIRATLFFFLFYGVYSALASDNHNNLIGACMVLWFFYFLKKKNFAQNHINTYLYSYRKREYVALDGVYLFGANL
tara:strand:- start:66610 stop:66882 length:273 start_codon:yes stop_codon:yes gene_type:complete